MKIKFVGIIERDQRDVLKIILGESFDGETAKPLATIATNPNPTTMTPNNEPAFPVPDVHHPNGQIEYGTYGMSLRDWFAGHAMQQFVDQRDHEMAKSARDDIALAAYAIADAMLSARSYQQHLPAPTQPQ
jgi:hypothetical protein